MGTGLVSLSGILPQERFSSLPDDWLNHRHRVLFESTIDDSGRTALVAVLLRPYGQVKANESKPEAYPQWYAEDFDEPRTKLTGFFSILLGRGYDCDYRLRHG